MAADAEAGHESGGDERDGIDPHAGLQGEQALPGHLVHESRRAAQDERHRHHRRPAPAHRSP